MSILDLKIHEASCQCKNIYLRMRLPGNYDLVSSKIPLESGPDEVERDHKSVMNPSHNVLQCKIVSYLSGMCNLPVFSSFISKRFA